MSNQKQSNNETEQPQSKDKKEAEPPQPQGQEGTQQNNGPSEAEIREESSKAAEKALKAQQAASDLKQAAQGAGDADERQKLMEEAIDKEIEAESLGKMAKYMRGGGFQGMAVGAGLGTAPGLTLGALTGTLVGGLTSVILGGLGAGVGGLVGKAHGPFWNMGEAIGKGIRKITGDLPSWSATPEQKQKLEEMISQAGQEKMPGQKELTSMVSDGKDAATHQGKSWYNSGSQYLPGSGGAGGEADKQARKAPRKLEQRSTHESASQQTRQAPPKLERRSDGPSTRATAPPEQRKPRKLEKRSQQSQAS